MTNVIEIEVNNRCLVLGLDYLYREAMKVFEVEKLLPASKALIQQLDIEVIDVPIEGYYTESLQLTDYFRNVRTLQQVSPERKPEFIDSDAYNLLYEVTSSPTFGIAQESGFLPQTKDSLYFALDSISPEDWNVKTITDKAYRISKELADISLVGIAAFTKDAVVLTALRESVVLYASVVMGAAVEPPSYKYFWNVEPELEQKANRFIATFNKLTDSNILQVTAENAEYFYNASTENYIEGRCVRIAYDDRTEPIQQYHWAIKYENGNPTVEEFWDSDIWTTERYQEQLWNYQQSIDLYFL